jgi:hypothetical protein
MRLTLTPALALSLALCLAGTALQPLAARERTWTVPASTGVIGIDEAQLDPAFWVRQLADPDRVILDSNAIAAQNTRLHQLDKSIHDLSALQGTLDRAQVSGWIESLSRRPSKPLFDEHGKPVAKATLDGVVDSINLGAVPERQDTRYGLVVHRAALRTFPTSLRVFSSDDDHDIDRFQESALFPGDPVVVANESRDGQWWFVVSPRYAAWVEKRFVALGSQEQVLGYGRKSPYRIVTGARATTVFTQEEPGVSELQLDMGVRVPVLSDWPVGKPVNGQDGYTSYVIELPVRNDDGSLRFAPALLPRREPSQDHYLPLSGRNLIEQGFKFLGERYGWGHSYNGRDCSGFVSEIYRSMGVELPRNTSDQAVSPALNRIALSDKDSLSFAGADGKTVRAKTNGVTVSPLTPLLFNGKQTYVDRMTNVQRVRP